MYTRIITQEDKRIKQMELFVQSHPNGHFLQLPRWAKVKDAWLWRGILLFEEDTIVGTMSVLIRPLPMGLSFFYAPRGPVCDRNDPVIMSAMLTAAEGLAREHRAVLLLMDPDEGEDNREFRELMKAAGFSERCSDGFGNVQAQTVLRLPLAGRTEEDVLASFCAKTRYNIRVGVRKGVQLRTFYGSDPIPEEVLEDFTALNRETGRRDCFIPRDKEYFRRVLRSFGADTVLFMAYYEQTPIAGTIGMYAAGKAWYLYGASSEKHRKVMPNYMLQWEMIRHAIRRGCCFYDLRGVPANPTEKDPLYGLYQFKKKFGGERNRFTGLFVFPYRPALAKLFFPAWRLYRKCKRPGTAQ